MSSGAGGVGFGSHFAGRGGGGGGFGHRNRSRWRDGFAEAAFDPFGEGALAARHENRGQEGAEFFDGDAFDELAFVGVGNAAVFFGNDDDNGVGFFGEADGGAVAGAERFAEVLALGERENARGKSDAVAFEDHAAIMERVVWEENGFEHFRRGFAIDRDAGFDDFLEADGLFQGHDGADADFGKALDGLDDDFDIFALFAGGREPGEIAEFGEHAAEFGLENDQDSDRGEGEEIFQEPTEDFKFENAAGEGEADEDEEADDDGPAARAAHEHESVVD